MRAVAYLLLCTPWLLAQSAQGDELGRWRAQLSAPGPDGKEARDAAIERLLVQPRRAAHEILQARFEQPDPDDVRLAICTSLQRHWLLVPEVQFGGAGGPERLAILAGYVGALASAWRSPRPQRDPTSDPLWAAARAALQRVPARELDTAARTELATTPADRQIEVLWCLADMQQILFATTIANCLEAPDATVRVAAREALQLLTCHEDVIRDRAQFAAWFATYGSWRYVDLVERAARLGSRPRQRLQEQLATLRIDAARDVVRAHVARTLGVDWAAVQGRVIVDDPAVLDACLELLQRELPQLTNEDASPARQSFCRALVQRHRQVSPDQVRRRAVLLEVAAYLGRAEDTDLAVELVGLLTQQLDAGDKEARMAALRGLRRYPSAQVRARFVALATDLLGQPANAREELAAIVAALTSRSAPRWPAPLPTDPDKPAWIELLRALCHSDAVPELREAALAMAQVLDSREQRVPDVFPVLVDLIEDTSSPLRFRSLVAIHLQGWRAEPAFADEWVRLQRRLLLDPAAELRQQAADALAGVIESVDTRRGSWLVATIPVLRDRLAVELEPAVLRSLVDCLQAYGREPGMPERAIGALLFVLDELGTPVPAESQFRLEALLSALATIGSDSRAERGQWLAACPPLSTNKRRQGLRLILQSHGAIDLAKDVAATDSAVAERARQAMVHVIDAALLKPPREAWKSSPELLQEARDVRTAFGALDALDERSRLDSPAHRLLRLEVELATGKQQDVVQRAAAWLAGDNARSMSEQECDRVRLLAAEAQLALGRPEAARRLWEERAAEGVVDPMTLDLEARIGRALVPTDLAAAVEFLSRVYRSTPANDPSFRGRLVEWMQLRIRLDPALREETLREGGQHAALFQGQECPPELREAFEQLRAAR